MKTILVSLFVMLALHTRAQEIVAHVTNQGSDKMVTVGTNLVKVDGRYWDGRDGGGHVWMTFQLATNQVVVAEHSYSNSKGILSETVQRTFIPTNKFPYTFTLSQSTVTVSRAVLSPPKKPPGKVD